MFRDAREITTIFEETSEINKVSPPPHPLIDVGFDLDCKTIENPEEMT